MFDEPREMLALVEEHIGRRAARFVFRLFVAGVCAASLVAIGTLILWVNERIVQPLVGASPRFVMHGSSVGGILVSVAATVLLIAAVVSVALARFRKWESILTRILNDYLEIMRNRISTLEENAADVTSANNALRVIEERLEKRLAPPPVGADLNTLALTHLLSGPKITAVKAAQPESHD